MHVLQYYALNLSFFVALQNRKGTELWLGIDAHGLNIYEKDNKLNPKITFPWNETKNISFHDKRVMFFTVSQSSLLRTAPGEFKVACCFFVFEANCFKIIVSD